MADKKISALTAASTPLAGTEVLPIVQGGSTVKVPSDDLTVKNVRSNSSTGILQVTGPAAASTRVMTVPNANFTAARTDAANSFTGDQTLSTGNLIVSNGKGIDFSATPGTGTSELLNDYEEGVFTPNQGVDIVVVGAFSSDARYTKVGRLVTVQGYLAGVTSVAVTAGGQMFSNAPFAAGISGVGIVGGYAGGTSSAAFISNGSTTVSSIEAVGPSSFLFFTLTYTV